MPQGATFYMEFGQGKGGSSLVKNANIRKALALAIERKGLVSTIDGGASQRWSDMSKAEDILLEDAEICPLYYSTSVMLVRTKVHKAYYNRGNWDFKEAYLK